MISPMPRDLRLWANIPRPLLLGVRDEEIAPSFYHALGGGRVLELDAAKAMGKRRSVYLRSLGHPEWPTGQRCLSIITRRSLERSDFGVELEA
jgi:hypothetical protein